MKTIAVYGIWNRLTQHVYIGHSSDVEARFAAHKNALKRGEHHSRYLQRSWNIHGETVFEFRLITKCATKEEAIEVEQALLDVHFNDRQLRKTIYNGAKSNDPAKYLRNMLADSDFQKARREGIRKSDEFLRSVRANLKKAWTKESVAKRVESANKSGRWHASRWVPVIAICISTGERTRFESIGEAARTLSVWPGSIHRAITGKGKNAGNYTFIKAEKVAA